MVVTAREVVRVMVTFASSVQAVHLASCGGDYGHAQTAQKGLGGKGYGSNCGLRLVKWSY
jgi:hypothetical protein